MKRTLIIVGLFLFYSCQNKEQKPNESLKDKEENPDEILKQLKSNVYNEELVAKTINTNDTITYHKIANQYLFSHKGKEFFYYALEMAYKNNCSEAYYNIYEIIAWSTPKMPKDALNLMNSKQRNFAIYHLLKSYEMGYDMAKYQIQELFGIRADGKYPESSFYLKELTKRYSDGK